MIVDQLACARFFQGFDIFRAFFRAKQVVEKRRKLRNPVKIMHMQAGSAGYLVPWFQIFIFLPPLH